MADGGFTSLWAHFMLPPTRARSYLNILELGMLGIGIPSAIGAKLGNPDREVVCVTGDGAAGFHCMELQSAAREGAKITVVVFAEGSWSMEVPNEQMLLREEPSVPRWARSGGTRWPRASAAPASTSTHGRPGGLPWPRPATAPGPALVCVRTDRAANMAVPHGDPPPLRRGLSGSKRLEFALRPGQDPTKIERDWNL